MSAPWSHLLLSVSYEHIGFGHSSSLSLQDWDGPSVYLIKLRINIMSSSFIITTQIYSSIHPTQRLSVGWQFNGSTIQKGKEKGRNRSTKLSKDIFYQSVVQHEELLHPLLRHDNEILPGSIKDMTQLHGSSLKTG